LPGKYSFDSGAKLRHGVGLKRGSFFWIALGGAVALLLGVGILQYRWTSQITEATETRIGNNVESLMLDWHLDFYQQFSTICVALQVGPDSGEHDNWLAYRERYSRWSRAANHSSLIESLHIWETSQGGAAPRFLRLGPDQAPLVSEDPPQKLQRLLDRLKERSGDINVALGAWELSGEDSQRMFAADRSHNISRSNPLTGWQFDQSVPAIVHPIIHHALLGETEHPRKAVDWIVVVLDLPTIQRGILPDVTRKYIANGQYQLAVGVGGNANQLIYSSGDDAGSSTFARADATMNLFGPPPESTEGYFWQAFKNGNSLTGLEWHNFSGPLWFPVVRYEAVQQPWTLILRNQDRPLVAAVVALRRRNLVTGGLVMLLLLASMSLVVVASHRAQRLAKLEMDFVASVSHELRTPLSAIFSAGENIADGLIESKVALTRYGSIITGQATQLIDLVDQILLFAATRDGSKRYQLRRLRIVDLLQSVRETTAGLIRESGCQVEQLLQDNLPYILGDRPALTRCLQNLITNAVKYSPANRKIVIAARLYESGIHEKEVRIHVTDNGVGISASDLPHIFEPFYRSPEVVAAQVHGTGLGLALAKDIAEAMGGRLSVVSGVGKGSTFTLHLPVPRQEDLDVSVVDAGHWVKHE